MIARQVRTLTGKKIAALQDVQDLRVVKGLIADSFAISGKKIPDCKDAEHNREIEELLPVFHFGGFGRLEGGSHEVMK